MKISKQTIQLLSNCAKIRESINFGAGNQIRTKDSSQAFNAIIEIDEEFPRDFCVYDLNSFIAALKIFNEPEIEFKESNMVIKDSNGKAKINYAYTNPILIQVMSDYSKLISLDNKICTFSLTNAQFNELSSAASLFGVDDIEFRAVTKETILVTATTSSGIKRDTDNSYSVSIDVDVEDFDKFTQLNISTMKSLLKLMPLDYEVRIYAYSPQTYMLEFVDESQKIKYYAGAKVL